MFADWKKKEMVKRIPPKDVERLSEIRVDDEALEDALSNEKDRDFDD
jgi:hypothetical protein